jgi:AcrR family transcriptional regulator
MKSKRTYEQTTRADAVSATRERIVAAASVLLAEQPYEDVTLAAIAKASGVSHQTVLNHFQSKEGVARVVAEAFKVDTMAARNKAVPGDVESIVHVLVGEYEHMGDANARWALTSERLGSLAELIDDARASHQAWLEAMLGDALPASRVDRRRAVNALHAATDVYTWKLLRRDLGLPRTETERTMVLLVEGALTRMEGTPR